MSYKGQILLALRGCLCTPLGCLIRDRYCLSFTGACVHPWFLLFIFSVFCVVFLLLFDCLFYPMLLFFLDCSFLIAPSVFSNVYWLYTEKGIPEYPNKIRIFPLISHASDLGAKQLIQSHSPVTFRPVKWNWKRDIRKSTVNVIIKWNQILLPD